MEKKPFAVFPLGLSYLRAGLKNAGYECGILDFAHLPFTREVLLKHMDAYNPVLVGISIRNIDNCCMKHPRSFVKPICELVKWLRDWHTQIPIVLGGAGFSLLPRQWLERTGADFGIVGNGVAGMVQILQSVHTPRHYNKKTKQPRRPTLLYSRFVQAKAPPLPDREGFIHPLDPRVSLRHNVQTRTGCLGHCTYCAYPYLEGRKIRERPVESLIEEIRILVERKGVYFFDFVDSVFNAPGVHAEAVCRALAQAQLNVHWGCFMTPAQVTPPLIRALKAGGCRYVEWGIDSGSETMLHNFKKGFRTRDIVKAIHLCRDYELPFSVSLLFGGPGETMTTVKETLDLMDRLEIEEGFGLAGIRVLPKTGIYERLGRRANYKSLLEPVFYFSERLDQEALYREFDAFREKYPRWILL
jgi:radical SAM superfamily enzyme YgiQ (UPF0313 family)